MKHLICVIVLALVASTSFAAETAPGKPAAKSAAAKSTITLKVAAWDDVLKIVEQNKGKIVVVDLWSTSCQPCVAEFPGLVKLQAGHTKDVVCVSFNCNYIGLDQPEEELPEVLKFLQKQNAQFVNLMSNEEDEKLYKRVGIASIPVVRVYGRDGKLAKQFDNEKEEYGKDGFTYDKHITPYVKKLVESK